MIRPSCEDGTNESTHSGEDEERSIQVTLLAQAPLTNMKHLQYINVSYEVRLLVEQVCLADCPLPLTPTPLPPTPTPQPASPLLVALVIIVPTIFITLVLQLVLVLALIRRYRFVKRLHG